MNEHRNLLAGEFDPRTIPSSAREDHWAAPDGQAIRRIDFIPSAGIPARGSLLFVPGRGDCYEKYLEALAEWNAAGWSVTSMDLRGQALSGRLGEDLLTGHVEDFAVWVRDLADFWAEWCKTTPAPHVLVGHSMGGHICLRAVAERMVKPDAMVLSAPMLGLLPGSLPSGLLHTVARGIAGWGDRRRPAWKFSEKPGEAPKDRIHLLTHDKSRYADEAWWREQRPGLAMGPASWGWIERALASIRTLERPSVLESVAVPVLIVATRKDRLVSWPAIERAANRLPDCELVAFGPEARHEILRESDPVRAQAMSAIAGFLDRAAPSGSAQTER